MDCDGESSEPQQITGCRIKMVDVEVGADVFLDIGQVSKSPPGVDEDPNFAM
jgi:hypothetical protein